MQRIAHGLPKSHYYDACCVGESTPAVIIIKQKYVNIWTALGRGSRQICRTDKYGFPKLHRPKKKQFFDFQTGDLVKAEIPKGKYHGQYVGRVAIRTTGYFDVKNSVGEILAQGIPHRYCWLLQRFTGWQYEKLLIKKEVGDFLPRLKTGVSIA